MTKYLSARSTLFFAMASALAMLTAILGWHLWKGENAARFRPQAPPRGRWNLSPLPRAQVEPPAQIDPRVLSLPYAAATRARAAGAGGVIVHDRERASAGVNLYVSGHAPEARLVDMAGAELHRWRYPFERAFPGQAATIETAFFRRARLGRDGNLYAIYQGGGLIVLDSDSRLLWKIGLSTFNDFALAADGTLHLLIKEAKHLPTVRTVGPVLEDSIVVVDPSGRVQDRISLLSALLDSPFAALFVRHPTGADVLHANTLAVLDGTASGDIPWLAAGNLLVSLREIDTIGVVDPRSRRFVWAQRGPWDGQHEPRVLPNGSILLFDNRPDERSSRVLEFDPRTGNVPWLYPNDPRVAFSSPEAGSAQRLPNGNTLVTESERGRAFEITPAGEIVWMFENPHRAGPQNELVATLFDVVRYPASFATRSLSRLNPSRSQSASSRAKSGPR